MSGDRADCWQGALVAAGLRAAALSALASYQFPMPVATKTAPPAPVVAAAPASVMMAFGGVVDAS